MHIPSSLEIRCQYQPGRVCRVQCLITGTSMEAMPPKGWHQCIRPPDLPMHLPDQEMDHSMPICSMLRHFRLITHGHHDTPSLMQTCGQHRPHIQISQAHLDPRRGGTTWIRRDSLSKVYKVCEQTLVRYLLLIFHADYGLGNPHGASQALRPEYGSNLANTSNVPESFQGGGLHVGNIPQPCPSFNYNARHSSSPGTISSTEELLQEPLGPRSMQSVNAQNAAMAQELRQIIRLSQPEGNRTGAYPHVMDRNPYRGQASQPVTEDEQSMPRPNVFQGLGEGYGHRDPRDISQATHPEPEPRGLAPQEVGLRRRSRAPRVGAGSPRQSRNKRGKRGRPLTQEEKAHAKRVRKLNRKGCIHKRRKAKVIPRRYELLVTPQFC